MFIQHTKKPQNVFIIPKNLGQKLWSLRFFHLFSSYAKIIISFYSLFWYAALKCVFDMCECEFWGWIQRST